MRRLRHTTRLWRALGVMLLVLILLYIGTCVLLTMSQGESGLETVHRIDTTLPPGFLLGTATAAHQIEGGNARNDWARFEEEPGRIASGDKSGDASDHWHRVAEDINLMRALGANAYRFSIEWSRLEPNEGTWDEAAWAHYEDELRQLRAAGITPMVTLLHFTLPLWLAERGGATAPDFPERFGRFAAQAARRFGSMVELWCTLNEPNVQMMLGYLEGTWPPGKRAPDEAARAFAGLMRAHAAAAGALRAGAPGAKIGVAVNLVVLDPASRWSLFDWLASYFAGRAFNWAVYDSIQNGRVQLWIPGLLKVDEPLPALQGSVDFFGMNYYTRYLMRFSPWAHGMIERRFGPGERSDMNWEIYPEGQLRMLKKAWNRYKLPIYITENGIADAAGTRRAAFLQSHLSAISQAIRAGIPIHGYFYWSLIDNFEWAEGFAPRFGLYHVNYKTFARTPAAGSEVFTAWANTLTHR